RLSTAMSAAFTGLLAPEDGARLPHQVSTNTAPSIPACSKPWVRARRASLALLPRRPRHNERRPGAHVHCTRARPRPWRADAQCEGRWASWVLVLSRAAFVLSRRRKKRRRFPFKTLASGCQTANKKNKLLPECYKL